MVLTEIKTTAISSDTSILFKKEKTENISGNPLKSNETLSFTPNTNRYGIGDYSASTINHEWPLYFQIGTNSITLIKKNYTENLLRLQSFLDLEYNWNHNNAEPFTKMLIEKCIEIIKELKYQPEIFPTARDSIQFEYEKENGHYLEFEIFQDQILILEEKPDGTMIEKKLESTREISVIVNNYYA